MEFECNLLKSLRRAHSDITFDDDVHSEILAGYLSVHELSSDEEQEIVEELDETFDLNDKEITVEDLHKVVDILN